MTDDFYRGLRVQDIIDNGGVVVDGKPVEVTKALSWSGVTDYLEDARSKSIRRVVEHNGTWAAYNPIVLWCETRSSFSDIADWAIDVSQEYIARKVEFLYNNSTESEGEKTVNIYLNDNEIIDAVLNGDSVEKIIEDIIENCSIENDIKEILSTALSDSTSNLHDAIESENWDDARNYLERCAELSAALA